MSTLFAAIALVVAAPALKDPPPSILGNWQLIEWVQGGTPTTFQEGAGVRFLPGGKRLWREGAGQEEERGYKLIPGASPPAIDLIRPALGREPDLFHAVYKVDGDKLILAIGDLGGSRPRSIAEGREAGKMLMTFRRIGRD